MSSQCPADVTMTLLWRHHFWCFIIFWLFKSEKFRWSHCYFKNWRYFCCCWFIKNFENFVRKFLVRRRRNYNWLGPVRVQVPSVSWWTSQTWTCLPWPNKINWILATRWCTSHFRFQPIKWRLSIQNWPPNRRLLDKFDCRNTYALSTHAKWRHANFKI